MGIQNNQYSLYLSQLNRTPNNTKARTSSATIPIAPSTTASVAVPSAATLKAYALSSKLSFGRTMAEHKSWGAALDTNGEVNFKIFTFPDAKKVFVEIRDPEASDPVDDPDQAWPPFEKQYAWNQEAGRIQVDRNHTGKVLAIKPVEKQSKIIELENKGNGVFENKAYKEQAKAGDRYRFLIVKSDNTLVKVKDPYAMKQESVYSWSTIYDHNKYQWTDKNWMSNRVPEKISRKSKENGLTSPANMRIYEANIATLTKEGNFEAAKEEIVKIAKEKKFNTVHIMPVEGTFDINWGYDGVDKFAPQQSKLGGPDKLKDLIDFAHKNKLNVIMDIVPNHIGPDGNFLSVTGPYSAGGNGFGDAFNYEKENNRYVRDYIVNTALNWVNNYHCDGLRVDMTKFMESDFTMKQMAAEVHYHNPDVFMIAEDGRENDPRVTTPLKPTEECSNRDEADHVKAIENIDKALAVFDTSILGNIGFDSEWDFPYHKQIASAVLGGWDGRTKNMQGLDEATKNSVTRVKYPMSHDEIGNWDGTRLIPKSVAVQLDLFNKVEGNNDCERGQRAAHGAQRLLEAYVTGDLEKFSPSERAQFFKKNHIKTNANISNEDIKKAYNKAMSLHRLAVGKVYATPGPKMIFQGDDNGDLSYFKFFRIFSSGYESYLEDKGYKPGEAAFKDSKLNHLSYADSTQTKLKQTENYMRDLNSIVDENPALQDGKIENTVVHDISNVHGVHCKKGNNEIFSVANFNDCSYNGNYGIKLPEGEWQEIINSNDTKYGGTGNQMNNSTIKTNGQHNVDISIPENSIVIFKKVN